MKPAFVIMVLTLLSAQMVWAHAGVKDPGVMARMHAMKTIGASSKILRQMASGRVTFDAAQADAAKTALIRYFEQTPGLFEEQHTDPKSEALPIIWQQFEDFEAIAQNAVNKAKALDVGSLDGIRSTLPAVGQTCSSCHKVYRIED